jgi:hypothetical protein
MRQSKILVDTNAYLRLAKTIRPLLFVPFGDTEYCLYILPELNEELANRRLKNKFPWVNEDEFVQNRKHFPNLGKTQKKSIRLNFEYIWGYVQTDLPGPSRVDAWYIAYALELNVTVVTDDQDMTALAEVFEVQVVPTLELLKIMLECGHTDMKTIDGLVEYWKYISDTPANLDTDYQRLFNNQ